VSGFSNGDVLPINGPTQCGKFHLLRNISATCSQDSGVVGHVMTASKNTSLMAEQTAGMKLHMVLYETLKEYCRLL